MLTTTQTAALASARSLFRLADALTLAGESRRAGHAVATAYMRAAEVPAHLRTVDCYPVPSPALAGTAALVQAVAAGALSREPDPAHSPRRWTGEPDLWGS